MAKNKKDVLILSLVIVVVLMLGVFAYMFLIGPAINGFITNEQAKGAQQGIEYAVYSIMQQASTCQAVPLTFGNVTMNIVAVDCLSQAQEPQA